MPDRAKVVSRWPFRLLVALVVSSGCYVTAPIKPSELSLLDGYHDGEPVGGSVLVLSPTNGKIEVTGDSQIFLDLPGGTYGGTFKSIRVKDGVFTGVNETGKTLQVPLGSIQAARVNEPNRAAKGPLYILLGSTIFLALATAVAVAIGPRPPPNTVGGRALRVSRRVVAARPIEAAGWEIERSVPDVASLPREVRGELARLWTESARSEHASVPAFSRLALSLVALGAPARLVRAAHRAALDEIEHARLAFSLAGAYAGMPVGPGALPELQPAPAVTATSLAALAAESLIDGCLLEGVAAEVAWRALERTRDGSTWAALAVIAGDESSHAELAWDVVRWCCERGGDPVRRHLLAALAKAPSALTPPRIPGHLSNTLADHGWLDAAFWAEAHRKTSALVAARVAALGARLT